MDVCLSPSNGAWQPTRCAQHLRESGLLRLSPWAQEKTNNTTSRIQSTVQFHFTSASVPRIRSGTYGQIPRPVDLMGIDQTLPGSHTVPALILLQLSIAIYSLEGRPSNPFWVNPAFWCRPIDLLYCCLSVSSRANVFIWWIPRQTHIKAKEHHLIRFYWIHVGKLGLDCVLYCRVLTFFRHITERRPYGFSDGILRFQHLRNRSPILSCLSAGLLWQLLWISLLSVA